MSALVVGMGASGFSIAAHLASLGGAPPVAVDSRKAPPMAKQMAQQLPQVKTMTGAKFEEWGADKFAEYERIAVSPGVAPQQINAPKEKIVGDAGLFAEAWQGARAKTKLLAVTGTNGKSATASIARDLCRAAGMRADAIGNIGEPLLDALARWQREGFPDAAALELSSFQLETAPCFQSRAAAVLNVDDDHLDRHGDIGEYAKIKSRIYEGAQHCIVNADDGRVSEMKTKGERVLFSLTDARADWCLQDGKVCGGGESYSLAEMSEASRAQPANVLAALALTATLEEAGNESWRQTARAALAKFEGLPHRRREVLRRGGVVFIDDSKATNVRAACFALQAQTSATVLIAGGDGKGQDFAPLAKAARGKVVFAVLIGKDAKKVQKALQESAVKTATAADMQGAVDIACAECPPGGAVLLSPACSSLDMFADYRARAAAFVEAARRLPERENNAAA